MRVGFLGLLLVGPRDGCQSERLGWGLKREEREEVSDGQMWSELKEQTRNLEDTVSWTYGLGPFKVGRVMPMLLIRRPIRMLTFCRTPKRERERGNSRPINTRITSPRLRMTILDLDLALLTFIVILLILIRPQPLPPPPRDLFLIDRPARDVIPTFLTFGEIGIVQRRVGQSFVVPLGPL